ncbi:MAG: molybdate ABC transporter substrate-binding protein [Gemmatimonadales bacterium]
MSSVDRATDTITVFAASDLVFAFGEIIPAFESRSGAKVRAVFGSTGNLALQIRHGAPADVFFAANADHIDQLREAGVTEAGSHVQYARGRIALATRARSGLDLATLGGLARPAVRKIAIANPDHAPYGLAARQALEHEGLWTALREKLVYAENIRQTLQFLQTDAVDAAIIALSIAGAPGIEHVLIDEALHRPIDQFAAVVSASRHRALARSFLGFVVGPEGKRMLRRFGFVVPS